MSVLPVRSRHTKAGRRRRLSLLAATALMVPVAVAALPAPPAAANLNGSTFEGNDGNLVLAAGSTNTDWVNAPHFAFGIDKPSGKSDDAFAGGVDENTINPTTTLGAVPNSKDDLRRFYAGFEQKPVSGTPHEFIYLAWIRAPKSQKDVQSYGSADMDFELNQSTSLTADGLPQRTPGDVLITYEFTATRTPDMALLRWRTSSNRCWSGTADVPGTNCWAERTLLNSTNSEGMVNDLIGGKNPNTVTDPRPEAGSDTSLQAQRFGEAAVDLTLLNVFSPSSCTKFARVYVKSRSSQSFKSSLQDYILPASIDLSNCLTKSFDISAPTTPPDGTVLHAVFTIGTVLHDVALIPSSPGHLTGSDSTVVPGSTLKGLHLELRDATTNPPMWSSSSQDETITSSTLNTGTFTYDLALTPPDAENFVNKPHVFTATVTASGSLNGVSSGPSPLKRVTVNWAKTASTPAGCGTLSPSTSVTDDLGKATSTLTSDIACSVTVRAWVNAVGGTKDFDSGEKNQTGHKAFAVYKVTVGNADKTNESGKSHTFSVLVTRDVGSGPQPLGNAVVSLSIKVLSGNPAPTVVSISPAGPDASSCRTATANNPTTGDKVGECRVTVTSNGTGSFELDASYNASNDSGTLTISSSGKKTYVNYRVVVTPPTANNAVGVAHTFTVEVDIDSGSGFVPVPDGVPVSLDLAPGTSDTHYVSINNSSASGSGAATCTTATAATASSYGTPVGTCKVVVNSTSLPGTAVLTATFNKTLDSGPLTRSAYGTKQYTKFALTVTPLEAVNQLGQPHTFTVRLTRQDDPNVAPTGLNGETIGLALTSNTADGRITDVNGGGPATTCTTQTTTAGTGTCLVTIVSDTAGTIVLQATWNGATRYGLAALTANGTKHYLDLQVSKTSCNATAPVGGFLRFDIPYSVHGADLTNARITDNLPAGMAYTSSTPTANSAPTPGSSGAVVWNLGNLADGASGSVSLVVQLTGSGTLVNQGDFTADGGITKHFTATVSTSSGGASASGHAFGLSAEVPQGTSLVSPTPYVTNGDASVLSINTSSTPLGVLDPVATVSVGVLNASNHPVLLTTSAEDRAKSSVADVHLTVGGVPISAKVVAAESDSTATGSTAGTGTQGSEVVDLSVAGSAPLDYSSPASLPTINAAGNIKVDISVLEQRDASGAAKGGAAGAQPQGGLFSSGLTVNGLHITATLGTTVVADVIVAQATSQAAFPSLTPCPSTGPYLIGQAYLASTSLNTPVFVTDTQGLVTLPSTGTPSQSRTVNTLDVSPLVFSGTGTSSTSGTLATRTVDSDAQVQGALLTPGAMTLLNAALIHAHASVNSANASGAQIGKTLVVAGVDVCAALASLPVPPPVGPKVCLPAPNTTLLDASGLIKIVLNEQLTGSGVITVNAIHIYVLGAGNPLSLAPGREVIISSATAGTGG